jgi:N-acetylglucosaminyldiphosphoundecaprenol N-acetyl-beta-D-mannosaminyltransferase
MNFRTVNLLGTDIAASTIGEMCDEVCTLGASGRSSYICFATAHMVYETTRNVGIQKAYADATVVTPDGVPVSWMVRKLTREPAECISGPLFFPEVLQEAEKRGLRVGFYGGREETLSLMRTRLAADFPLLKTVYSFSPPFRSISAEEQANYIADIKASGVQLLFIGLGSPKQERWMNEHSHKLPCTCLGVGAVFEFFSGEKVLPPLWIQKLGMNWLVRLLQEPRRLFIRNLYSLPFLIMSLRWVLMNEARRKRWRQRILQRLSHSVNNVASA